MSTRLSLTAMQKNQYTGRNLGVFTSGGDSQGMNAAVRAIVRMGIYLGCKVYLINEGYQGMVDGKDNFKLATWSFVSGIVGMGGTIIGSARCKEFRERNGRLKAAKNLIKLGISNLVCIGGDGTLTGANLFRVEWSSLLQELLENDEITTDEKEKYAFLNIVGIVGSIDNDFCGTDMTIGADSALHRIIESIDAISTTALSHQRCFILEVMGRNCGYLALLAGLASEADFVLVPENPPEEGWEEKMCKRMRYHRDHGHRLNIIIVAEGAIDQKGNPITPDYLKDVIVEKVNIDTRVTILGHVQRGGTASAYDRVLGARMGSEAVLALMKATSDSPAQVVAVNGNQTCLVNLMESVERTQNVAKAIKNRDFKKAAELRGFTFQRNLDTFLKLSKIKPKILEESEEANKGNEYVLAVMNIGAPACGVNSAIRSFVRYSSIRSSKIKVLGIQDGFEGLMNNDVKELDWKNVFGWTGIGGSLLGTQRTKPKDIGFEKVAIKFQELKIKGLLIIGGFEAYNSVIELFEQRPNFQEFCIPLVCVPATISNNVPGSDISLGSDTSLNEIVNICDKLKLSAMGSKRRVFIVETMGGFCGYLASMSALASGADHSFIFEEPFTINEVIDEFYHLKNKMGGDLKRGMIIRNEYANKHYSTKFIEDLLREEAKGEFSVRMNILGHMQQGGVPSPFDRNLGIKFGSRSLRFMADLIEGKADLKRPNTAVVAGLVKNKLEFSSVKALKASNTDFEHRIPLRQWWIRLRALNRILGQHEAVYLSEIQTTTACNADSEEEGEESESENGKE